MAKNEKKGGSPKDENRCPVCGRFASKKVLDACKGMMSEVEKSQRDEIARLELALSLSNEEARKLHDTRRAYDELLKENRKLRVENERLRERGFFDYLLGR